MHAYKKFLLCLDLTDDSEVIAERAKSLAGLCGASLTSAARGRVRSGRADG